MAKISSTELSIVVPLYNEAEGLERFNEALTDVVKKVNPKTYEIIYCDDGSTDKTNEIVSQFNKNNPNVQLLRLSRNFGKENALVAGIAQASGQVIMTLDGDGQHPVELIPKFVEKWEASDQVVVGVRTDNRNEAIFKRFGSSFFYMLFNKLTNQEILPGSTDFRLIDRVVAEAFLKLNETDRITRGLIDWLGFKQGYVYFKPKARESGSPGYSRRKLFTLATNSFISLTPVPLYIFGLLGVFITATSLILGLAVFIEQILLGDFWHWKFTGTAMLSILLVFLVGIVLMSQGILSLYISRMHNQIKQRPLYVVDYGNSTVTGKPHEHQS